MQLANYQTNLSGHITEARDEFRAPFAFNFANPFLMESASPLAKKQAS
ncbi:MAG: hypothetical protein QM730_30400 [Anaerolineales bacterium]